MKKKTVGTITIDNEYNDDWMKSLPGYQNEVEITESALREEKPTIKITKKKKK